MSTKSIALCYFHIRQLRIVRVNIDGSRLHTSLVKEPLLQGNRIDYCNGINGFQSEIPHWEATVGASCRCQTRPKKCQSLARFLLRCVINFTGWASNQEWSLNWLSWLTSRFTVLAPEYLSAYWMFQCRACQVAHIFDLLIKVKDHARPQNSKTVSNWPCSGFLLFENPSVWNSLPVSLRDFEFVTGWLVRHKL